MTLAAGQRTVSEEEEGTVMRQMARLHGLENSKAGQMISPSDPSSKFYGKPFHSSSLSVSWV